MNNTKRILEDILKAEFVDVLTNGCVEKINFLYDTVEYLKGTYNEEGIREWFSRERILLSGKTPIEYLGQNWSPKDKKAKYILDLAKSSQDPGAT